MKTKFKKLLAVGLVLMLSAAFFVGLPAQAFAAGPNDAGTCQIWDSGWNLRDTYSFNEALGELVTGDTLVLLEDITVNGNVVYPNFDDLYIDLNGNNLTINNGTGEALRIKGYDLSVYNDNEGVSNLTITGSVFAEKSGLWAYGDRLIVTVNGSFTANGDDDYGYAIIADYGATVNVNGSIFAPNLNPSKSSAGAVYCRQASLTITGNVDTSGNGAFCYGGGNSGESTLVIQGFINAGGGGLYTDGYNNTATVNQGITALGFGIMAKYGAEVTVTGNVNATTENTIFWGDIAAICVIGGADVTVLGNVTAYYDGIWAWDESNVYISGNVTAGYAGSTGEDWGVYSGWSSVVVIDGLLTMLSPDGVFIMAGAEDKLPADFDATTLKAGYWQYSGEDEDQNPDAPPSYVYLRYHYTLTVNAGAGGSVSGTPSGYYPAGDAISVSATANSGYTFTGWTVTGIAIPGGNSANPAAFAMPGNNVVLTANFVPGKGTPATGDGTGLIALGALMLVSIVGATLLVTRKRQLLEQV
ncbi:MAG: hypothetical protein FWD45_02230 [Coriobacteriia bacterium]|nr:hypothetical protein [Coriobacteriia bacterium]